MMQSVVVADTVLRELQELGVASELRSIHDGVLTHELRVGEIVHVEGRCKSASLRSEVAYVFAIRTKNRQLVVFRRKEIGM